MNVKLWLTLKFVQKLRFQVDVFNETILDLTAASRLPYTRGDEGNESRRRSRSSHSLITKNSSKWLPDTLETEQGYILLSWSLPGTAGFFCPALTELASAERTLSSTPTSQISFVANRRRLKHFLEPGWWGEGGRFDYSCTLSGKGCAFPVDLLKI